WVFMDEHPDSINDGLFAVRMPSRNVWGTASGHAAWDDVPASYHNGAGGLSYADGHAEIRKWVDANTRAPITKANPSTSTLKTSQRDHAWLNQQTTAPK